MNININFIEKKKVNPKSYLHKKLILALIG